MILKRLIVAVAAACGLAQAGVIYSYTGSEQFFAAPATGTYEIIASGAQGGSGIKSSGQGAEIAAFFNLLSGETLGLYVGQQVSARSIQGEAEAALLSCSAATRC